MTGVDLLREEINGMLKRVRLLSGREKLSCLHFNLVALPDLFEGLPLSRLKRTGK